MELTVSVGKDAPPAALAVKAVPHRTKTSRSRSDAHLRAGERFISKTPLKIVLSILPCAGVGVKTAMDTIL